MPLIKPVPPATSTLAFRDGLRAFLAGPSFGGVGNLVSEANLSADRVPSEADLSPPGGPWDHDPQQVFTLGLTDLKTCCGSWSQGPPGGDKSASLGTRSALRLASLTRF